MFKTIDRPASCEIRAVIRFLNARNIRPCEIYSQISETYEEDAMIEGMVRKWVRMFSEGRENVQDEERSRRPSLIIPSRNDDPDRFISLGTILSPSL
ncbi:hypothetical protein AVEN_126618-1 [Araneus ventricosus]|uniref:Mos1 transposase HTH domain-containing protein n=1 Tax=Araneus ventricosus TaxID=182803 RepID=A0A4Y2S3W5_ARAVE|nr:hypothetical protein AVEN_126618-1 [Araneus ventricosus]